MSLIEKSDEDIIKIADPIWNNLVKSSNIKDYGGFTKDFSSQMLYGANEVELGKQWANNDLISSLKENCKPMGCLRRGAYVTVIYKQNSSIDKLVQRYLVTFLAELCSEKRVEK